MSVIDRTARPPITGIQTIPFEFPEMRTLDNGTLVYCYSDPEAEVLKIEFQFPAGTSYSMKRLDAAFTNKLIASGTSEMTEKQISEKIDYYGAYFDKHVGNDEASFAVYSLKKHASDVLKIVAEILKDPIFPEEEVETFRNIKKQKFRVKMEKVNFIARRSFTKELFGDKHPYGGITELNNYDSIDRDDLLKFHKARYLAKPVIMLSGNIDDKIQQEVAELFGKDRVEEVGRLSGLDAIGKRTGRIAIEKKDTVQSAIRIGRMMFTRLHPEYANMQVLTTVFGGYFGSRLMSNLREEKGFTYGVGCGLASMLHEGYFFISTEVGADTTKLAEQEILFEMKRLREERIPAHELDLVKNYLLGQILKSTDGVFARMNRFKSLQLFGQPVEAFHEMVEKIQSADAAHMQELANEWLREEDMLAVVAGKP